MSARIVIALCVFFAIALVGGLGSALNDAVVEQVQERRLQGGMDELRARLETHLRLGLALAGNEQAQAMLEDALARLPMVDSIEIDSHDAIVLFSTDRALRSQAVPLRWQQAARAQPESWHAVKRDEHSVGVRLHDAFGQPAGYLVWTHQEVRDTAAMRALLIAVLAIAATVAGVVVLAVIIAERLVHGRRLLDLAGLQVVDATSADAIPRASRILAQARAGLAQVDREVHRIAGIET
ncbi:MAG: hypothetical protein WDO56_30275 [Gammaproteobacteria bacterium]